MGEFFKDRPKLSRMEVVENRIAHLLDEIRMCYKMIGEKEFEAEDEFRSELREIKRNINDIAHNLANHEHKDGRVVVIEELNEIQYYEEE